MTITQQDRDIVQNLFDAMQMGVAGEHKMMALFADDAVMTDPFDQGVPQTNSGKPAIRDRFVALWTGDNPQDLKVSVDQIDAADGKLRVEWTCVSQAFLTPMYGLSHYTIRNGLIAEYVVEVVTWPEYAGGGHA